jgi:methionyl aminopeptidase
MDLDDLPKIKDEREIGLMRQAGRIVGEGLLLLQRELRAGMTTEELDAIFEKHVRDSGAKPTFKGYRGFTKSLCTSINEEVVHGIPSPKRVIKEGDLVKLDAGATFQGYVGDSAVTVGVGKITPEAQRLLDTTRESLEAAIQAAGPGVKLSAVSRAVQQYAESRGYSVVKQYVGHGIGSKLHEAPQVPNFVDPSMPRENYEYVLKPGICLAIEPMLNVGTDAVRTLKDEWTVVTRDGKLSAHFEHTILITPQGRDVLTRISG